MSTRADGQEQIDLVSSSIELDPRPRLVHRRALGKSVEGRCDPFVDLRWFTAKLDPEICPAGECPCVKPERPRIVTVLEVRAYPVLLRTREEGSVELPTLYRHDGLQPLPARLDRVHVIADTEEHHGDLAPIDRGPDHAKLGGESLHGGRPELRGRVGE